MLNAVMTLSMTLANYGVRVYSVETSELPLSSTSKLLYPLCV